MTQSVELILDPTADAAVRSEWRALGQAGLPTAERRQPSPSHRPHLTLVAVDVLSEQAERALPSLLTGLDLTVQVGAPTLFGPRADRYVLARSVVASTALLDLQGRVARLVEISPLGLFGPGRWTPHLTLARRVRPDQVAASLAVLGAADGLTTRITGCRRWDSDERRDWLVADRVSET